MAKRTLRQLANQLSVNVNELIQFFGAKNGNEEIDENDPKIAQFINRGNGQQTNAAGNLFTEVAKEYQEELGDAAVQIRLGGGEYLRREVARLTMMPTNAVLDEKGEQASQSFRGTLQSMWNPNAPFEEMTGYVLPEQKTTMLLESADSTTKLQTSTEEP